MEPKAHVPFSRRIGTVMVVRSWFCYVVGVFLVVVARCGVFFFFFVFFFPLELIEEATKKGARARVCAARVRKIPLDQHYLWEIQKTKTQKTQKTQKHKHTCAHTYGWLYS